MRIVRFLRVLLAAFAMAPVSAVAGQVYLIGFAKSGESSRYSTITSFAVPMESLDQCRASGEKLIANNANGGKIQGTIDFFRVGYDCIEGK
jgi:hypothetical protein